MMNYQFAHFNFNVTDLERSLTFYREALGLKEKRRKVAEDGSFIIVFLTDGATDFELELTWLRDWDKEMYDLGDCEFHLAVRTPDLAAARASTSRWVVSVLSIQNGHLFYSGSGWILDRDHSASKCSRIK